MFPLLLLQGGLLLPKDSSDGTGDSSQSAPAVSGITLFGGPALIYNIANFGDLPNIKNCCPKFGNTLGAGGFAGIGIERSINKKLKLGINLSYNYIETNFEFDEPINLIIDGSSYNGVFRHILNTDISYFDVSPFISAKISKSVWLTGGINLSHIIETTYLQYEKIVNPTDRGTFTDGTRIRNYSKGNMERMNNLLYGFNAGVFYILNLDKNKEWFLLPFIRYSYFINNYFSGIAWDTHTLQAGASILYSFEKPVPKIVIPASQPPLPLYPFPKEPAKLEGSLSISSAQAGSGDTILIEEFATFGMKPLLNYIFFDEDSFAIPSRYIQFNNTEIPAFAINSADGRELLDFYYNILNIIAARLKLKEESTLSIVGCNSGTGNEKNNLTLSEKRARSVRNYFVSAWGIDSSRIKIISRNLPANPSSSEFEMGEDENRRVELYSSDSSITESIIDTDTISVIKNPVIRIGTNIISGAGIKECSINLSDGTNVINKISYSGRPPEKLEINFESLAVKPKDLKELYLEMTLIDSGLQVFRTVKRIIPIERITVEKKRRNNLADKKLEFYSIMLFEFAASNLSAEHRKAISFIKSRILPGATVKVTGYSDVIGDEKRNAKISESRALAVAEALGLAKVNTEGVGESVLLFDNSLPEGRFYCRTVNITIENPIR